MILLKQALRGLWFLAISQLQQAIRATAQAVATRQQRHKALPVGKPMPALAKRPVDVLSIPFPDDLTATEMESIQVAEQTSAAMIPSSDTITDLQQMFDSQPAPSDDLNLSQTNRTALVEALLDEAWQQGLRTYPQLMKYVELQSGTGCSRRAIARWKTARNLTDEAQAA
jgi:hypothetical protein